MGVPVLVLGESGQGKSTSLRNFSARDVGVFNVLGKPLPFRGNLKCCNNSNYADILHGLGDNNRNAYIIDDANYLMTLEEFARAKETGYTKFSEMAQHFQIMLDCIRGTSDDTIVYVLMHPEYDANGKMKPKTTGKMLNEKLCVEGLFTIVLIAQRKENEYIFTTQSDGFTPAKSPMGMFEQLEIPNDLAAVDKTIREYYGMKTITEINPATTTTKEKENA